MNAEFNWWLLIVGLVVGAGLVWLVVADSRRREVDVAERERPIEARWIAEAMADAGRSVTDDDVLDILRLHAAYLAAAPPDEIPEDALTGAAADDGAGAPPRTPIVDAPADAAARRAMAHPIAPERPDREGGQA